MFVSSGRNASGSSTPIHHAVCENRPSDLAGSVRTAAAHTLQILLLAQGRLAEVRFEKELARLTMAEQLIVVRTIDDVQLARCRYASSLVSQTINEMRSQFAPAEDMWTVAHRLSRPPVTEIIMGRIMAIEEYREKIRDRHY